MYKISPFNLLRAKSGGGFTLVELLIVVGILGILSATVVTILNPAELLKRSRDATRFSDIDVINKALSITAVDNLSLGTSSVVFVSIPDTVSTCANLGLPTLPTGWSYQCATTANFHNVDGTGWLPVNLASASTGSPLSSLPIDPTNATSSGLYYTFSSSGSSWTVRASQFESLKYIATNQNGLSFGNVTLPHVFPENWVKVPGNSTFGTSDFYVMKYNATCVRATTNAPLTAPDAGNTSYSNSAQPCVTNYYPASTPEGYSITNITHANAKAYCANIGAHLLTNDEWMTIARNVDQVGSNWTGGSVGSGKIYSGHYSTPNGSLTADPFGDNGYYGETVQSGIQRRTFTLSNGSIVWDIGGNGWQHVQRSTNNVGDATSTMTVPTCSSGTAGWVACHYGSSGNYISAWTADVPQINIPSDSSWNNTTQGVGIMITYGAGGAQTSVDFLRGGGSSGWYAGYGLYGLLLQYDATMNSTSVTFRCAR